MQSYNWFGFFQGAPADNNKVSKPQQEQKDFELNVIAVSHKDTLIKDDIVVVHKDEAKLPSPPVKNKPLSRIFIPASTKQNIPKSYHKVEKVKKVKKKKENDQEVVSSNDYFLKRKREDSLPMFNHDTPPLLYELEAAYSDFYALLCPDRVTSTWAVYDEDGKPVGVLSKAIPGFKSLKEAPLKEEDLNKEKYIEALAEITTASYIFEEDDLHKNQMSPFFRLDFDMSVWPETENVKGQRILNKSFIGPSVSSFEVSSEDIINLPELIIAKPYYWPTTERMFSKGVSMVSDVNTFTSDESALFRKLKMNSKFIYTKFKMLLKYILTEENTYRNILKLHVRESSLIGKDSAIERIAKHEGIRINSFKTVLTKMPEFRNFLRRDGARAFEEIKTAFQARNDKLAGKSYGSTVSVDLEKLSQQFELIKQKTLGDDEEPTIIWDGREQITVSDLSGKGLTKMMGSR